MIHFIDLNCLPVYPCYRFVLREILNYVKFGEIGNSGEMLVCDGSIGSHQFIALGFEDHGRIIFIILPNSVRQSKFWPYQFLLYKVNAKTASETKLENAHVNAQTNKKSKKELNIFFFDS